MPNMPKFDPVRRNGRGGVVVLPAEGRKGEPPPWPLDEDPSPAESKAWRQLWSTPRAVAWGRVGWTRTLARLARMMVAAEQPDATSALRAQVVALEDRHGLTPRGMRTMLWTIADDELGGRRQEPTLRPRPRAVDQ
jgi:hypothetical protein